MEKKKTPRRGGYSGTPRKRGSVMLIGNTPKECADWRNRVEAKLAALGWSRAQWAREARVGKSTVTGLLNGTADGCADLKKLHDALGWNTSPAVLPSLEEELLAAFRKLPEIDQGRVLEFTRSPTRKD